MRVEWESRLLGDLCDFVRGPFGGSLTKSCFKPSGFAVYEQQHAIYNQFNDVRYFIDQEKFSEMQRFELRPGDLIMSCSGTMGKVAIVPKEIRPGIINQALLKLTPRKDISIQFLKCWMESPNFQASLSHLSKGAAIKNVPSVQTLKQIRIELPPLPEQHRIVAILDEAFAGLAIATAHAARNLKNARELFESYLRSLFLESDKLWKKQTLAELCTLFVDSAHRTPKYQSVGIPALRPRDIVNGKLSLGETAKVSEQEYEIQSKRHRPTPGDIVYSRELSYGWAALLPDKSRVCLSQGMCLFRPRPEMEASFLLYVLNGPIGRDQAIRAAVGTAHPHINLGDIKSYRIPTPTIDVQREVVAKLDALLDRINQLETTYANKLTRLADLKQSVLKNAFSGTLAKHAIKEAAE